MVENDGNNQLTVSGVFRIFLESYLKDGIFSKEEMGVLNSLRENLKISETDFNTMRQDAKERFKRGELGYKRQSLDLSNRDIYRDVVRKAGEDRVITPDEKKLIFEVGKVLNISKEAHLEIIEEIKQEIHEGCSSDLPDESFSVPSPVTSEEVIRIFFEEYYKDGEFDEAERKRMHALRKRLSVDNESLREVMQEVIEQVRKKGKSSQTYSHEENNRIIFRRILDRAFSDGGISESEESILHTVAEVLEIPDSEMIQINGKVNRVSDSKASRVPDPPGQKHEAVGALHKKAHGVRKETFRHVTVHDLGKLYRQGIIDKKTYDCGTSCVRPRSSWYAWADFILLTFGATLVLTGIIFFFAYNWNSIGKIVKFGVLEASIIACVFAGLHVGTEKDSGKVLLMSASVLVGVLLAVFGQIYQTGADPYELFAGWSLLILGWVAVSEFAPHITLWIVLVNTGLILYWMQVLLPNGKSSVEGLCCCLGLVDLAFLCAKEYFDLKGVAWLRKKWFRGLLLLSVLSSLLVPAGSLLLNSNFANSAFLGALLWASVTAVGFYYYRHIEKEIEPLSMIVCSVTILVLMMGFRIMIMEMKGESGMFFVFAWFIIGVIGAAVYWIGRLSKNLSKEKDLKRNV